MSRISSKTDKVTNTIAILNSWIVDQFNSLFGFACFIVKDIEFLDLISDSDIVFHYRRLNKSIYLVVIISLSNLQVCFCKERTCKEIDLG